MDVAMKRLRQWRAEALDDARAIDRVISLLHNGARPRLAPGLAALNTPTSASVPVRRKRGRPRKQESEISSPRVRRITVQKRRKWSAEALAIIAARGPMSPETCALEANTSMQWLHPMVKYGYLAPETDEAGRPTGRLCRTDKVFSVIRTKAAAAGGPA